MSFETLKRECRDCGSEFLLTPENQAWYHGRRLDLPKRCHDCRQRRKVERQARSDAFEQFLLTRLAKAEILIPFLERDQRAALLAKMAEAIGESNALRRDTQQPDAPESGQ